MQRVRADLAFKLPRKRWMGFVELRRLCCPHGHHFKQDVICLEHAALRCKARDPRAPRVECGARLFVLNTVGATRGQGMQLFVVEITEQEWMWLQDEGPLLTPNQILQRLGAGIPEEASRESA